MNNLRAAPWKILALPLFLLAFARAARRAARDADVVHAHWLPIALPALATGQAVRAPALGLGRRPRAARAAARAAARPPRPRRRLRVDRARRGRTRARRARRPRDPERRSRSRTTVGEPDEPPHVLYVGRLSEEKGVRELAEAADGLPLVVVGDGPLRDAVPAGGRLRAAARARRRSTSGRRSSSCRRVARGTASPRARRWRTAGRSSRPRSAGWSTPSRTASRACSSRRATSRALREALEALLGDAELRHRSVRPRRARARERSRSRPCVRAARGGVRDALRWTRGGQSTRQRRSVRSTRSPSSAVSFLPSSRERASYVIGTS